MPFNPPQNHPPISPHTLDASYTPLRSLIATGGGGDSTSIILVRHTSTHLFCVRKALRGNMSSPGARHAWREELELHRSLSHRNIVGYVDAFMDASLGQAALFTEFCDLGSLGDLRRRMRGGPSRIPEAFVWHVLRGVVGAVVYCHRGPPGGGPTGLPWLSVVHRDIKPDNIFLQSRPGTAAGAGYPLVKLGDFGAAIGAENPEFYAMEARKGTRGWQPPEFPNFGQRGDVWSVGAVAQSLCRLGTVGIEPGAGVGKHYGEDLDECVGACLVEEKADRPYAREVALMVEELGVGSRYCFKALPPWAFG